ncbi:MBL fold metallo-hydrolase [Actinomadura macra]|uniref:MBL fold metallo-hydrolase n=1 Tax=Actinomadura macra TaxID=46164 RepID=UPI000AF0594F|nr:MBL fold metallo-hydrolase [Actinomadura macra]
MDIVDVETIETASLGDRSYVAHDGEQAIVVDPQRDLDRVRRLLDDRNLRCALVLETHIHNDYVSGGLHLARSTGATYAVSAAAPVAFVRRPVADGDALRVGDLWIRVVATPGHTENHLAYIVNESAVFTGGSLLYGSVGRTDLVDPARTDALTRAQFRSAQRLAELCEDDARVYPTHGFGSFCSSGSITDGASVSTIGEERTRNDALVETDEDAFVSRLVAGLTAYPRYYAHMGALNLDGAGPADLSPPSPVAPEDLAKRIVAGDWVVDLRSRTAYAAGHLLGTIGIELGQNFATYLGWLIPWGTPLTLLGDSPSDVADAQRQLTRIGIDRPSAALGLPPADLRGYRTATFAGIPPGANVLDVRRDDERAAGSLPGSTHIPLHSLTSRLDEVPPGEVWVHCATGYRASIAASLLDRAGREVVLIDDTY